MATEPPPENPLTEPAGAVRVRQWPGLAGYESTLTAMRAFTDARTDATADEIWLLQHAPLFTQGQAGLAEHLLPPDPAQAAIPVIRSDRGGQITYHGPGQIVAYLLVNLHRRGYGIRSLVSRIEQAIVDTLAGYRIAAYADPKAPGVYVDIAGVRHKIASLGLRVRRGCSYHGLALNTDMDLAPFQRINPCGYPGLQVTQVRDLDGPSIDVVRADLVRNLVRSLGFASAHQAPSELAAAVSAQNAAS